MVSTATRARALAAIDALQFVPKLLIIALALTTVQIRAYRFGED